jgi:hypothetical protein
VSDERLLLRDPHDLHNYLFFTLGALAASARGDDPREVWARKTTLQLLPAISAAIGCAMQDPERFRGLMGGPIQLEGMPE